MIKIVARNSKQRGWVDQFRTPYGAKIADFPSVPAQAGEVQAPFLVFLVEELDGERPPPRLEDGLGVGVLHQGIVTPEVDAVVGDTSPLVYVELELRPGEEFESAVRSASIDLSSDDM